MSLYARVALGLAIFLAMAGLVYAVTAQEYVGTVLFLVASAGFAYIGLYVRRAVRASMTKGPPEAAEEPHVTSTIWPFVFSLAGVGLVLGAVVSRWLLVIGGALFVAAAAGWFIDINRQWSRGRHG